MTARPETAAATAEELLTIDELAFRTGTTVRNIRFYATEGLLPPPVRSGRMAYYSAAHRLRLEFISQLQEHGYTLAGIERVLARIPADASPDEVMVHRAVLAPWGMDPHVDLTRAELEKRAGRNVDDATIEFLIDLGLLQRLDDGRFRTSERLLAPGLAILETKVPLSVLREASAVINEHATAVADGLAEVFRRGIWDPYRRGELADLDPEHLVVVVSRLRPLAVQGLVGAFERASDRAMRQPRGE